MSSAIECTTVTVPSPDSCSPSFPSIGFMLKSSNGTIYQVLNFLGKGSFGQTFAVLNVRNGVRLAMKVLDTSTVKQQQDNLTELKNNMFLRDSGAYDSPLMQFYEFFVSGDKLCVVFEKLDCTLFEVFMKEQGPMRIDGLRTIAYQILSGVSRLHSLGLVYCDLKLDNVMYANRKGSRPFDVKLIDFGLLLPISQLLNLQGSVFMAKGYRAPELYLGLPLNEKIDIWSIGVILYELYTGMAMLWTNNEEDGINQIASLFGLPTGVENQGCHYSKYFTFNNTTASHGPISPLKYNPIEFPTTSVLPNLPYFGLSNKMYGFPLPNEFAFHDLLIRLLSVDSRYRITASEALQHPFFKEIY